MVLSDPTTGREVFDLRRPLGRPDQRILPAVSRVAPKLDAAMVGAVERDREGEYVVLIHAPVRAADSRRYVLTVEVDPNIFQAMLAARAPPDSTAALVDPSGNFIARSLDHERRVGQPATAYVREGRPAGRSGHLSRGDL